MMCWTLWWGNRYTNLCEIPWTCHCCSSWFLCINTLNQNSKLCDGEQSFKTSSTDSLRRLHLSFCSVLLKDVIVFQCDSYCTCTVLLPLGFHSPMVLMFLTVHNKNIFFPFSLNLPVHYQQQTVTYLLGLSHFGPVNKILCVSTILNKIKRLGHGHQSSSETEKSSKVAKVKCWTYILGVAVCRYSHWTSDDETVFSFFH